MIALLFLLAGIGAGYWAGARGSAQLLRERRRLEILIRHIPDGLLLCNLSGDVLQINPRGIEILGIDGGKSLKAVNTPELRGKIQEILKIRTRTDVIELPTGYYRVDVTLLSAPGSDDIGIMILLCDIKGEGLTG